MNRRAFLVLAMPIALAGCARSDPDRVDACKYDSFWLWAGVAPPPELEQARTIYLLDSEIRDGPPTRYVSLRPAAPHLPDKQVWLVIRTNTLAWPEPAYAMVQRRLEQWRLAGNGLQGLQIDFDARTRHLDDYVAFLSRLRRELPPHYKLSITGLMDWSANGDSRTLAKLNGTVDEVVIQTYQGRSTIWGYERYFERMKGFPIPFKVGLVENGRWIEPRGLNSEPNFKGYVVFLLPRRRSSTS